MVVLQQLDGFNVLMLHAIHSLLSLFPRGFLFILMLVFLHTCILVCIRACMLCVKLHLRDGRIVDGV